MAHKRFFANLLAFILLISGGIAAQNIVIKQSNESGIYHSGENIRLKILLTNRKADSVMVSTRRNYSSLASKQILAYKGDSLLIFSETASTTGSIIFDVTTKTDTASLGLMVDPEKLTLSTARPKDFEKFWKEEKKQLRALTFEINSTPLTEITKGYSVFNMEINCTGPKPVRGYYAKPENARPGSLPIVLFVHAAGVSGNWCRSEPGNALRYAQMEKGAICFDLNAHGMLVGQPEAYYKDLEKNELNNYSQTGLENRATVYFHGMYLRLMRTLDYLTQQPEWDGKRILVIGESQGGGQALAAAGLDPRVTAVVASVPAMCDWGRTINGSKGGWPNPFGTKNDQSKMLAAVPYFDAAHLLKGSKATIVTEIGLIDFTCSSESVYAAINQAGGQKIIYPVPFRAHQLSQMSAANRDFWDKNIGSAKDAFIREYLK
jgi:cephalosporin-C deacetylase-like acetyl esterase